MHQLDNFLDITCKIGGFNLYHQQKTTYTIVQSLQMSWGGRDKCTWHVADICYYPNIIVKICVKVSLMGLS